MAIFVSRRSMILAGGVEVASSRRAIILRNSVRVNMETVRLVGVQRSARKRELELGVLAWLLL